MSARPPSSRPISTAAVRPIHAGPGGQPAGQASRPPRQERPPRGSGSASSRRPGATRGARVVARSGAVLIHEPPEARGSGSAPRPRGDETRPAARAARKRADRGTSRKRHAEALLPAAEDLGRQPVGERSLEQPLQAAEPGQLQRDGMRPSSSTKVWSRNGRAELEPDRHARTVGCSPGSGRRDSACSTGRSAGRWRPAACRARASRRCRRTARSRPAGARSALSRTRRARGREAADERLVARVGAVVDGGEEVAERCRGRGQRARAAPERASIGPGRRAKTRATTPRPCSDSRRTARRPRRR